MKVQLSIDIELPDKMAAFSESELRQALYENYVNAVRLYHLEWAQQSVGNIPAVVEHLEWSIIAKDVNWSIKREAE